jgi:hypothetical protein
MGKPKKKLHIKTRVRYISIDGIFIFVIRELVWVVLIMKKLFKNKTIAINDTIYYI